MRHLGVVGLACAVGFFSACTQRVATCEEGCETGFVCDEPSGTCERETTTSSSGNAVSSSGGTSSSSLSSSSSTGGTSSATSGASGTSTSGASSSGASSGGQSSSVGASSSAAPTPCSVVCGGLADGGHHVAQWECDADAGVSSCRAVECATDYADCADAGTTCAVNTASDPLNCGGCGAAVNEAVGTTCSGGQPACGATTGGCNVDGGFECETAQPDAGVGNPVCCPAGEVNCGGNCTNTMEDLTNCGGCGRNLTADEVSRCTGGTAVCGVMASACESGEPFCIPSTADGGVVDECFECIADGDCSGGTPVCCGGTCVATADACGCGEAPGSTAESCNAGGTTGGACIGAGGTVLGSEAADIAGYHTAACGCAPAAGDVVSDVSMCAMEGTFFDLCAPVSTDGGLGACVAQNFPARTADAGAGNCGAVGNTCDPSKGGLTCVAVDGGYGECECNGSTDSASCLVPVPGSGGRAHVVADTCRAANQKCSCDDGVSLLAACNPNTDAPDCCSGDGCTNLADDPNNCGTCGALCSVLLVGEGVCGRASDGLQPGQCGCDTLGPCPNSGGGGGRSCESNKCLCDNYKTNGTTGDKLPCPLGSYCCAGESSQFGCCSLPCGTAGNTCVIQP